MKNTKESKELIEIKEGIWSKIKNWFKNFFRSEENINYQFQGAENSNYLNKQSENSNQRKTNEVINMVKQDENSNKNPDNNSDENLNENPDNNSDNNSNKNPDKNTDENPAKFDAYKVLLNAKNAFENYNLHKNPEITKTICSYIQERIEANASEIEQVINLDNAPITYNDIIEIFEYEMKEIDEYKQTISMKKIDNNFMLASYKVPKGIIKIYSYKPVTTVRNIFKAVITRNSVVIVESDYRKYSVQNLILLIVQELLKKFDVDENIIQVISKNEDVESIQGYDEIIFDSNNLIESKKAMVEKAKSDMHYIYMQDEFFSNIVKNELRKMNLARCKASVITGKFEAAVEQINKTQNVGVAIYTQDQKLAYRFINLINSDNVYVNASIVDVKVSSEIDNRFFRVKNIAYEIGKV